MIVTNTEIAEIFDQLANLLEIEDANAFRVRAYRNASQFIGSCSKSIAYEVDQGKDLTELPGIGKDLAQKIQTIVDTGELPALNEIKQKTPEGLLLLLKIEGLGPKRVKRLYKELNITNLKELNRALRSGRIKELKGFGAKMIESIQSGIENLSETEHRYKLAEINEMADILIAYFKQSKELERIDICGSFRRQCETIGDLDILISAENSEPVIEHFVNFPKVADVISKGTTRSSVRLKSGLHIDLRVVPEESYGAAMLYFTGSKAHNIVIRQMAMKKNLKINEYGVFKDNESIAGKTEAEIYQTIDLPYIEPELRENRGEIQAAMEGKLPNLISLSDIRGDLHSHTKATDGVNSLDEMAQSAIKRGYDYLAITDHSKRLTIAHGLDKTRILEQVKAIDEFNEKNSEIRILKSVEVDILEDGSLDLPDDVLQILDFRVCSVHYNFNLSREKQTERILRAMDNPNFNILAHPSGRLINQRKPYEVDLEKVMREAKARGCFLEINAQPMRMDLNDVDAKMAKEIGVKCVISSDSHSVEQLEQIKFGVSIARRAWLEPEDVINTLPLNELLKLLQR